MLDKDNIIKMAREAGCKPFRSPEHWDDVQVFAPPDVLERFAALVAAAEREACAKFAEECWEIDGTHTAKEFAAAIRARGNT